MKIKLNTSQGSKDKPEAKVTANKKTHFKKRFFRKSSAQKRDENGKFSTGGGGLLAVKKLNLRRIVPVIVVISLAGGLLVFKSFAGSANGAFVTEMYQRCYNVMKTSGSDYTYWLNKLDKGESRNTVWATFVAATGKPCSFPYPPKTASATPAPDPSRPPGTQAATMTAAQVTALYKELLNRDPSTSEVTFWVEKSKTWTAAQIKAQLQASNEYFRKNIAAKVQEAEAWKKLSEAHVTNAKNYNAETYKLSTQTVVSRENLATISTRERAVRDSISQVAGGLSTIKEGYQKATANNAPEAATFKTVIDSLTANTTSLNAYLKNISADYARAQKTYEANLKFFQQVGDRQRQEQDCRNRGGTPTWTGGCNMPAPQPATNNGGGGSGSHQGTPCNRAPSSNISACQRYLGVKADGIWGPITEAAFQARFGYRSGWGATGGSSSSSSGSTGSQSCPVGYSQRGGECRPRVSTLSCSDQQPNYIGKREFRKIDGGRTKQFRWSYLAKNNSGQCVEMWTSWVTDCGETRSFITGIGCLPVSATPNNAKCKSGNPVWSHGWAYSGSSWKFSAFRCAKGFKSMTCPTHYKEASQASNDGRWHYCTLL